MIHQANYLLDRQIDHLQDAFVKEGGLRERMTRARLRERDGKRQPENKPPENPENKPPQKRKDIPRKNEDEQNK